MRRSRNVRRSVRRTKRKNTKRNQRRVTRRSSKKRVSRRRNNKRKRGNKRSSSRKVTKQYGGESYRGELTADQILDRLVSYSPVKVFGATGLRSPEGDNSGYPENFEYCGWECGSWDQITGNKPAIKSYMNRFAGVELVQHIDGIWKKVSHYSEQHNGTILESFDEPSEFASLLNLGFSEDIVIKIRNNIGFQLLLKPKNPLQGNILEFSPDQQLSQIEEVTGHRP